MGYRKRPKTYTLRWGEDHELHGLEVILRGLTVAKMLDLTEKASSLTADVKGAQDAAAVFRDFARSLVGWNLEDEEGRPVPATYEGVRSQDLDFILDLITTWMDAVAGVDNPLPQNSPAGDPALEASLQMEPLSASLAS